MTTRRFGFVAAAAVLLTLAPAMGSFSGSGLGTLSSPAIAIVNGSAITRSEYDAYAAVFRLDDGSLRVTPDQVLRSVINQTLAAQEAALRGIVVTDADVDSAAQAIRDAAPGASFRLDGGLAAFRARIRARLLMEQVKAVVAVAGPVGDSAVRAAYDASPGLHAVPFDDLRERLAARLQRQAVEARWVEWLTLKRDCSDIRILDPSFTMGPHEGVHACP